MAIENLIQNLKNESSEELGLALNEARGLIKKYVVLESEEYFDALTLWIASTYTQEAFQYFPRVVFSSPDKQCGKTTALTIVEFLVEKPQRTSSISVSALFRTIEAKRDEGVVLLMDEIDSTFSKNGDKERGEATRQIINEGFIKNGVVHRTEGKNFVVKEFRVACPIVMAGIGKTASPETIRDRSLIFPMRRVLPNERLGLGRLRHKWAELEFAPVRERLANALKPMRKEFEKASDLVEFPEGLSPRQEDVWENLLAVAYVVGGEWRERALRASLKLCDTALEPVAVGREVEALSLCKDVFEEIEEDRISASDLVSKINALEHSPYKDHSYPLNAKRLANLLDEYGIRSVNQGKTRNYHRKDFEKSWAIYLLEPVLSVKPVSDALDGLDT